MKLKLFALKNLTTGRLVPGLFFHDKQEAKKARAVHGADTHCVTYGPDHRKYKA